VLRQEPQSRHELEHLYVLKLDGLSIEHIRTGLLADFAQHGSELLHKAFDPQLLTFGILVSLSDKLLFLVVISILYEFVEMIIILSMLLIKSICIWLPLFGLCALSFGLGCFKLSNLLLVLEQNVFRLAPQLFFAFLVKSVMSGLSLALVHQLDNLRRQMIDLWPLNRLLMHLVDLILCLRGVQALVLQIFVLILQELIKLPGFLIGLRRVPSRRKRASFERILFVCLCSNLFLSKLHKFFVPLMEVLSRKLLIVLDHHDVLFRDEARRSSLLGLRLHQLSIGHIEVLATG